MDDHDTDHEVGAPKMQCAEIPAEGLIKIQILQTGVSLISGGHIDKGQTDAGHDLEDKTKQGTAAEDIKPTACTCRHCVTCGRFEELANMQSVINPKSDVSQHQNSCSSRSIAYLSPTATLRSSPHLCSSPAFPRGRMTEEVERLEQFKRLNNTSYSITTVLLSSALQRFR